MQYGCHRRLIVLAIWTGFACDDDILWLSVRFQRSKISKVPNMIYNIILDVLLSRICAQSDCTITRIWPKSMKIWQTNFSHILLWLYGLELFVLIYGCMRACAVVLMEGMFKMTFIRYGFINLIFFFKKRGKWLLEKGTSWNEYVHIVYVFRCACLDLPIFFVL